MRTVLRILVVFLVCLAAVLANRIARAQVSQQGDPATQGAREHFNAGVRFYDGKPPDYERAIEQFRLAYADRPSAGIKRNIALCLRALGRYPEAMDALDEMLAEGGDSLKPDVRDAANKMLTELDRRVASLRIIVQPHPADRAPPPTFTVTLDGVPIPPNRLGVPVRVLPGEHVVQANASGFPPSEQKIKVDAGAHGVQVIVEPSAVAPPKLGRLAVHSEPLSADIAVDGVVLAKGEWSGNVGAGTHHIEVRASGYAPLSTEADVEADGVKEVVARLERDPNPVSVVKPRIPRQRRWYVLAGLALEGERLTLNHVVFRLPTTTDVARSFTGGSLEAKVGRRLGNLFGIELVGEIGSMSAAVPSIGTVSVTDWTLAPEIVLRSRGAWRAKGGIALGLEGQSTKASLPGSTTTSIVGAGVAGMGLVEAGAEYGSGGLLLAASVFGDIHGIGAVTGNEQRLFWDSPAARIGLRAFIGYQF